MAKWTVRVTHHGKTRPVIFYRDGIYMGVIYCSKSDAAELEEIVIGSAALDEELATDPEANHGS